MKNRTRHTFIAGPSQQLASIPTNTVHLVVTSPPYPMIEMWDEIMGKQNPAITTALTNNNGQKAFELMHKELDKVWTEVNRTLIPGGIACINIGDATRTIGDEFALYSNHARIIAAFIKLGFINLPSIIWRKPTNAPNKFMGSGMLAPGAYVTLEHEWILIFRKGGKRLFKSEEEKQVRRESGYFWEERNNWFSDTWELKGVKQPLFNATRDRTAAYPFELPYRLINMFSVKGDTVLDPFLGTGTTSLAALVTGRNSIGVEVDPVFCQLAYERMQYASIEEINSLISDRLNNHYAFVEKEKLNGKQFKYINPFIYSPVTTSQEMEIRLDRIKSIVPEENSLSAYYIQKPVNAKNSV